MRTALPEQHLAEAPLVAEVTEAPHELVHQGDRLQRRGGGPVRRVLVRLGAHALVAEGGVDRHGDRRPRTSEAGRPAPAGRGALRRLAALGGLGGAGHGGLELLAGHLRPPRDAELGGPGLELGLAQRR